MRRFAEAVARNITLKLKKKEKPAGVHLVVNLHENAGRAAPLICMTYVEGKVIVV